MIAYFLNNISAKYYKNPSMLSRVIAKNVGDVFLRHSIYIGLYITAFLSSCTHMCIGSSNYIIIVIAVRLC